MALALAAPLPWPELARRTIREAIDDDCLGLAAQLSYYFFLALFPAILFLLATASFFPLDTLTDDINGVLEPFVSPEITELIQDQMRRLANADSGGLLTFGVLAALWSSSSAIVSVVSALNRAYDIEEGRPWWKVRLIAITLTIAFALFVLCALSLVLAGPRLASYFGERMGWGPLFEWAWLILQWPLALVLVSTAIGLVYYFGPDAEQDWAWVTPGAILGTIAWLLVSLGFKLYVANFTDYDATYGTIGAVIVLMLWFYLSGLAILAGAELNAEIEHASPHGKAPGEKSPSGKRLIGRRAARAYEERQRSASPVPAADQPIAPVVEDVASQSVRELLGSLSRDFRVLLGQTMALARAEVGAATASLTLPLAGLAAGMVIAAAGLLVIISSFVLITIALGLTPWAASALVGVAAIVAGVCLTLFGVRRLRQLRLDLPDTRHSVAETVQWLKAQAWK